MKNSTIFLLSSAVLSGLTVVAAGNGLLPLRQQKIDTRVEVAPNGKTINQTDSKGRLSFREARENQKRTAPRRVISPDHETYFCDFEDPSVLDGFTIINSNGDEKEWYINEGEGRIYYNSSEAMDDWLITPAISLETGKRYIISFNASSASDRYPECLEVFMGRGTEISDASEVLMEPTLLPGPIDGNLPNYGFYFTPQESGDWYIMFHGMSDADQNYMRLDNISVSSPDAMAIPGEDAIEYQEITLLEEDFSNVGGSEENPIVADSEDGHYIAGLPGWRGFDVFGIGGAILLDGTNTITYWTQLTPPAAEFTHPDSEGNYRGRITIGGRVYEYSQQAIDFNYWESVGFNGMKGSTECPGGWVWAGQDASFSADLNNDGSWTTMVNDVTFGGTGSLIESNFDDPNGMVGMGTFNCNTLSGRMVPDQGSKIIINYYKISELVPVVPTVGSWTTTEYTPEGFTIEWEPAEEADFYMVELLSGNYDGSYLSALQTKQIVGTECHFDVNTGDDQEPLYVRMYVVKGELRSPYSAVHRVWQVNRPELSIRKSGEGEANVSFEVYPDTHLLNIFAQSGKEESEDVENFSIADISFANYPDTPEDEEVEYSMQLGDDLAGWIIYPNPKFEDGAFVANNLAASWGMGDYMTISGDGAYDFSNHEGTIRMTATAKTTGSCTLTARLLYFNDMTRSYEILDAQGQNITSDFATYSFELDPQKRQNIIIELTTSGQDTNYIKNLKVECDLKAGEVFLMPYLTGYLDFTTATQNSGDFSISYPADADQVRVVSQAVRYLIDSYGSLYYIGRSPFSEDAILTLSAPSGTENIIVPVDNAVEYYNLQGIRVRGELPGGVYIRKKGEQTEKVIVK